MKRSGVAAPVQVGRYAVYGEIGSGGMATVHLGRAGGERVAIKRLRPHFLAEPDMVKSFLDEARLSARVRHPNVVATLDVVTQEGEVFLVMEYVDGISLAALTRGRTHPGAPMMPPSIAAAIVTAALRGLHAAHEAIGESGEPLNIVHRDVSPQNILAGIDGTTRILDFGIAKALGRQQTTRDGRIKGKLGYMAPEQLSGRGVTRRTDVFAAGIVLWELLAGSRLFRADNDAATITRVLMEPVQPPSVVSPTVSAAFDPIVLRALERDPSKRFLTADEMACALEEAVSPATRQEVGAWVKAIAEAELVERARHVRDIETESATVTVPIAEAPPPAPRRALLRAAVVVGFALTGFGVVWATRDRTIQAEPAAIASTTVAPSVDPLSSALPSSAPASTVLVSPPSAMSSAPPLKPPTRRPAGKPGPGRERLYSRD
jgi:serine/threonine protein kinase